MEVSNKQQTVRNTGIAAGIGALGLGAKEVIKQKKILAHPDEFIMQATAEANKAKRFSTPFFAGSQEASEAAFKQIDNALEQFKSFATGGKLNFKQIAKTGAIGAAIGAGVVLLYEGVKKLTVKMGVENKKIEREIVTNSEANQAIKDINDATGATTVQTV